MKVYEVWIRNKQGQEKVLACAAPDPRSAAEKVLQYPEYSVGWEVFNVLISIHDN